MNMFDEARSMSVMMNMRGMTQNELAQMLGVSQPYIANKIRLLRYPEELQRRIIECRLSERHARAILRLPKEERAEALERVIEGKMSVALTEVMVDNIQDSKRVRYPEYETSYESVARFEDYLDESLKSLSRLGIGAKSTREIFGDKLYISICIG